MADIGLVGLPNAGKSTFLSTVSQARPKVADYPFTTLQPHLGMVYHNHQGFAVADLPGLIEGASEGAGLGHRFLKHVSRNRVLLHFVDITPSVEEIEQNIAIIRKELEAFDPELLKREQKVVFTKIDTLDEADLAEKQSALLANNHQGYFISSQSGLGVKELLNDLADLCRQWNKEPVAEKATKQDVEEDSLMSDFQANQTRQNSSHETGASAP